MSDFLIVRQSLYRGAYLDYFTVVTARRKTLFVENVPAFQTQQG
jgi:hypothetical protein